MTIISIVIGYMLLQGCVIVFAMVLAISASCRCSASRAVCSAAPSSWTQAVLTAVLYNSATSRYGIPGSNPYPHNS